MAETLTLKAQMREHTGSRVSAKLREQGMIPAIVYGHKKEPVAVCLDEHNFVEGLHHGHRLMNVEIDGDTQSMIVKDLQYDELGKNIIHADLMRVDVTERVKVTVPIELKGTAKGTHEGGIIEEHCDHIEIECRVTDIPESIIVSVKEMDIGDSIHARDIELATGAEMVSDPELLLVTCHVVTAAKTTEELEEEEPAAPEVIGEAKEEEEPEEQQGESASE